MSTLTGHKDLIEDIKRSPVEDTIFATCSVDRTIKIWDTRLARQDSQMTLPNCHTSDINVIDWNTVETSHIASGADDGSVKVWDLRMDLTEIAHIQWHSDAITSVAWNPKETSELAVSSADDRISIWNFGVEAEPGAMEEGVPS
jgi:ribosome assembly protein RRB1